MAQLALDDVVEARILPGWREDGGSHMAGLEIRLAPGWKTYWRAPGDAGIPPRFDWSGSENLTGMGHHWPVPEVFWQNGMRSIGYADRVVIPLRARASDADAPITLQGTIDLGVCEEICIPARVSVTAVLPPVGASDGTIHAALADRAMTAGEADVGAVTCTARPVRDGVALTVAADMPPLGRGEVAVIELRDPAIWVAEPTVRRDGDTFVAETELVGPDGAPFALDRSSVRMTVFAGGKAVDIRGCTGG